jgi:hypothetical protein
LQPNPGGQNAHWLHLKFSSRTNYPAPCLPLNAAESYRIVQYSF